MNRCDWHNCAQCGQERRVAGVIVASSAVSVQLVVRNGVRDMFAADARDTARRLLDAADLVDEQIWKAVSSSLCWLVVPAWWRWTVYLAVAIGGAL